LDSAPVIFWIAFRPVALRPPGVFSFSGWPPGASEWQITRTVVIPSTMAWVLASPSPAISFALIGVVVGESIGAERGIGRLIIESEARAEASGMMVAVIVLMLVGVALSAVIWRLQAYRLRWQQHNMVE